MIFQWGLSFFGQNLTNLFGLNMEYILNVVHKEIFYLVAHGFSAEYIRSVPVPIRKHYINLLIEKNRQERESVS